MTFIKAYTTKLTGVFYAPSKVLLAIAGILLLSLLFACHSVYGGQDGDTYSVGGSISRHSGEVSLNLTYGDDNKTETLNVPTGTENFTFGAKLVDNQSFTLSVTAPTGQTCRSSRTQGTIVDANITDIEVICLAIPTYSIGGMVSGLTNGENITLTLSPTDGTAETKDITGDADDTSDDNFAFDTRLVNGVTYTVTTTSPASKTCTVNNAGPQMMGDADVTDVTVACVAIATYSVGGEISGLTNGETITLTLSPTGGTAETEDITADADGTSDDTFTFDTRLVNGTTYTVTTSQSTGKTCTVAPAGTQTMGDANVAGVVVNCVANTYSVGGTVSGLANGETITLTLSPTGGTAETKDVTGDADETAVDTFTFDTAIAYDTTYEVTTTSPVGKACMVAPTGRQSMGANNVTDVAVTCVANTNTYSVSGTVTRAGNNIVYVVLTLYDDNTGTNLTRQSVRINSDGTFSFDGILANKFYILQASSTAVGEICSGPSTTPVQINGDVRGVPITCSINAGTIINILLVSFVSEASLTTINFFVGDNAIPDTSGNPTQVIKGTDADVVIVPNFGGLAVDAFQYNINVDANKYYAITATTTSNSICTVPSTGVGGPVTANVNFTIECR